MELLNHFQADIREFSFFSIKDEELDTLLQKLPKEFRRCYVSDDDLEEIVALTKQQVGEILRDNYIPANRSVMSGEFGEIFAYFFLKEYYLPNVISGPKKWIWKDDKDAPVHKTDIMLFNKGQTASPNDVVVSAEVKAKATGAKSNQVENAIKDMQKDYVSRLALSLNWLRSKYLKDKNIAEYENLERFVKPVEYGTYLKEFKAVVIIDSELVETELAKPRNIGSLDFDHEVIVITFNGLKEVYEQTYEYILNEGGEEYDSGDSRGMDSASPVLEEL